MFTRINKSYYKYKIVITFSVITAILVIGLSQISYRFIKNLYLTQISNNLTNNVVLVKSQINSSQLELLRSEIVTESTKNYFRDLFSDPEINNIYSEVFIFDHELKIFVHSNKDKLLGKIEPRLYLNEKEIIDLTDNEVFTSLPFLGNDNNWYLWGFKKLSSKYYLAVKESASNFESLEDLSTIMWYFGIIGFIVSVLVGIFVAKSITSPITELVNFSGEIGKGNLNVKAPKNMKGELKILSNALDIMKNNIANNQKEKEKILAQIAHEIKNPLGGIELLTNLIYESRNDEEQNREYTKRILEEISGLTELITSYLDFSKPNPSMPEKIELNEIVMEALSLFQKEIADKKIKATISLDVKEVLFDKIHLRNILINLIKNSIESIEKNGQIVISTRQLNGETIITISDNGVGVPVEKQDKIFEPFYTTKATGTGLGLATCKKYCEENNAEIYLKQLQQETLFTIRIKK